MRSNLLSPPNVLATVEARLDLVELFLGCEQGFFSIFSILQKFEKFDPMLSSLVQVPKIHTIRTAHCSIKVSGCWYDY